MLRSHYFLHVLAFVAILACHRADAEDPDRLRLERGDHVCLVGNGLGERLQFHNEWEALLHQRFPQLELVVRNLCFPGDEPFQRERSLNFGTPDDHLTRAQASVVLYFFGFNESFGGPEKVDAFRRDLRRLVRETLGKDYGKGTPRLVLVSPTAAEETGDPLLPNAEELNRQLGLYRDAMADVAEELKVPFADVFDSSRQMFEQSETRLTLNGVQLNDDGYARFGELLDAALFGDAGRVTISPRLLEEIDDKNFHWFHRYRAVNGYSIWGKRGAAGSDGTYNNTDVMEREREILSQMTAVRDQRIWQMVRGESVSETPDDSQTLPFIEPKTNVGIPNDPNVKNGKLGSLDYRPASEQQKMFELQEGFVIELVASEEQFPELANPVSLNFDADGRLWVATMPSYPQWKPKTPMDDKILILTDLDGDGRSDQCDVFADGLHQPTGFELGMGGAFVAMQPDILFIEDTDGDGKADRRTRCLTGFDTADSHHGLSGFEWGPGGGLHFLEGTFKESQVESAWGVRRLHNAGVWRYEPRTSRIDVYASLAFANPWGIVHDRFGQAFIADASPGHNFWATPISGDVVFPDKHPGGSRAKALDRPGSRGKMDYPTFINKRIRPSAGCELVSSSNFPPESQGNFLLSNVIGDLAILQHKVREQESGYVGEEITPLVKCSDGNFRPIDIQFGPDGALYIVDWHNALIGHLQHNLRDPSRDHSHGRIWRVYYKDRPLVKPPVIADRAIIDLLTLLGSPDERTRYRVRRELAARKSDDVVPAVASWVKSLPSDSEELRLEALWLYQSHHQVNEGLLLQLLKANDHRVRAAAVRVLSYWRDMVDHALPLLANAASDTHPRVRLESIRACSFFDSVEALETALVAADFPRDPYLSYTLEETVRVLQEKLTKTPSQDDHHQHGLATATPVVLLNKSPAIVEYQLGRLNSQQLLSLERKDLNDGTVAIHRQLLSAADIPLEARRDSLMILSERAQASPAQFVLGFLGEIPASSLSADALSSLVGLFSERPRSELATLNIDVNELDAKQDRALVQTSIIALMKTEREDEVRQLAVSKPQSRAMVFDSLAMLSSEPSAPWVSDLAIESLKDKQDADARRAAVRLLGKNAGDSQQAIRQIAGQLSDSEVGGVAVATLLNLSLEKMEPEWASNIVEQLVRLGERTPVRLRSESLFVNRMRLIDKLMPTIPRENRSALRQRMRAIAIRVIPMKTVEEEMRYDTPFFAVEAGTNVQIVLDNDDLMPHNLVITSPGKLRDVAMDAMNVGISGGKSKKQYVPDDHVLFATDMVPSRGQTKLTFQAPETPGEYPYVCTFPQHWMRMNGVMVVVDNLDDWLASPRPPANPLGSNRTLIAAWKTDDFPRQELAELSLHSVDLGQRVFKEATCALCHRFSGAGGEVGPDLTGVFARWKGDTSVVLREVLDPSACIDEKFAATTILDIDGRTMTGLIKSEDSDTITLIENPEAGKEIVINKDDIELRQKSPVSLMPKGLLDQFDRNEILALLAYLKSGEEQKTPAGNK